MSEPKLLYLHGINFHKICHFIKALNIIYKELVCLTFFFFAVQILLFSPSVFSFIVQIQRSFSIPSSNNFTDALLLLLPCFEELYSLLSTQTRLISLYTTALFSRILIPSSTINFSYHLLIRFRALFSHKHSLPHHMLSLHLIHPYRLESTILKSFFRQ
jgi:hypothetical protein